MVLKTEEYLYDNRKIVVIPKANFYMCNLL